MEASEFRGTTHGAAGEPSSFIGAQLNDRSMQIGKAMSSTAKGLRRIARRLRARETDFGGAAFASRSADGIDQLAHYLRDVDGDRLVADIEGFTRRKPLTVGVAALTAGFAASRALKRSRSRRHRKATERMNDAD